MASKFNWFKPASSRVPDTRAVMGQTGQQVNDFRRSRGQRPVRVPRTPRKGTAR